MYDSPTVAPQELPTVRQAVPSHMMEAATIGPSQMMRAGQSLDIFGAGVAQAQASVQNAETIKNADTILYGDPNKPGSGFLNQNGQNAIDSYQDTVKALDSLSNGTGGLGKYANQVTIENAKRQAAQHNNQQVNVFQQSAGATRIKAASDGAALAYDPLSDKPTPSYDFQNPEQSSPYQLKLQTITAEANSLADLKGIKDPDLRADFIKGQLGQAYTGVLSHMLEGGSKSLNSDQIKVAQEYFKGVKDNLSPEQQDKIQHVLQAGALLDKVVSYSDTVMDSHKGSESAQFAQIRKDFEAGKISGQEREQIESRISQLNSRARQSREEGAANSIGQMEDFFIKNPGATVTDLPPNLYNALKNTGHLATADSFSRREANHTDLATLQTVQSHFGDGSENDITKMPDSDFLSMHGKLSDKDWKYWNTQRDNAQKGIFTARNDPGSVHEGIFNSALKSRLEQVGLDTKSMKSAEDKARLGGVQQFAKDWVLADQHSAGHVFNDEQIGKSLDRLIATNVNFRTTFLGADTGTGSQRLISMKYGDIPGDAKDGIRNALIKSGNSNPSNQDVLNYYWKLHGK
jgi:hypothetical protein